MSERALELATALEAELLAQYDKLETIMLRSEYRSFPIDERNEIERKHAEISGLLTQADFIKCQISRL
jgi:N-acetylmuramoyl-L-alanine amidase